MPKEINSDISGSLVELLDNPALVGKSTIKQWSSREDRKSVYSYSEIKQASLRLSSLFSQRDIQPHDRVILWGPNSPNWVISYFATLRAGGVVVPFDINAEASFLNRVIEATGPRLIIAGSAQIDKLPPTNIVPILNIEQVDKMPKHDDYQASTDISPADLAEIVFTSGTTGNPKGVVLTHGNIRSNVESIRKVVKLKMKDRLLSILPLSHMFETTVGMLTPMNAGSSVIYADTLRPDHLIQAIGDEHITCMAVVPEVLKRFKDGIEQRVSKEGKETQWRLINRISPLLPQALRRRVFRSLHERMGGSFEFFVCGGAPLDSKLANAWENFGIKVLQGYGTTETSPVVACDSLSDRKHAYVGRPLPGVDVRIAPDGEVLVKGPNVMSEYWMNPETTTEVLEDGWYHTGDLGVLERGRLKIWGRKKNMIVLPNGLNVYPEDVEQTLARESGVALRDSIVFYKETKGKGELHVVLLLGESNTDPQTLMKAANQHLAPHQRIQGYTVWQEEDFPRTHTRKAKRDEIIQSIL